MSGKDLIASAQTGTGKTAGYVLPILDKISRQKTSSNLLNTIITNTVGTCQKLKKYLFNLV